MLTAEEDFLRHRLAQLDYREPFDMSSAPLIRRLLADLVQTTDSARKFKNEAERARREKEGLAQQIAPLRAELARLTAENNQVHLDLVRLSDDRDARDRRVANAARKAATEAAELKFMAAQYSQKLSAEQRRSQEDREKAEANFAKMGLFDESKQTSKLNSKKAQAATLFERLQKIDIDTGLEPFANPSLAFVPPEPIVVDALKITQGRVDQLEKMTVDLSNQNTDLENEIQTCRDQVKTREQEIMRLGAQLELSRAQQFSNVQVHGKPLGYMRDEGAPLDPAESIHQLPIARARIEQLESQIEHLQAHIDMLEQERAGVVDEKAAFSQGFKDEREFLKQELEAEREKNGAMLAATRKLEKMVAGLEVMRDGILGNSKSQRSPTSRKSQSPNKELSLDLVNENERLQNQVSELESIVNEKTARIAFLEEELNDRRVNSPTRLSASEQREMESNLYALQGQLKEKDEVRAGLTRDIQNLRRQLELSIKNNENADELHESFDRLMDDKLAIEKELSLVTKERDDIIAVLGKFEAQLTEMHETVELLTSDRDNMASLYQQAHSELQKMRLRNETQESTAPSKIPRPGSVTPKQKAQEPNQTQLGQQAQQAKPSETDIILLKANLETANLRIQHLEARERELEEEVIKLQGDLKAMIFRQRESGAHAGETIRQIESERDSLKDDLENRAVVVLALEEKVQLLNEKLNFKEQEAQDRERKMEELRNGVGMMEMNVQDSNVQLKETRSKLTEAQSKLEALQAQLLAAHQQCREQAEKISMHRDLISKVDQEKDHFRNEIDDQAEKISELKASLATTRSAHSKAQSDLAQAYDQLDQMTNQLDAQDREVSSLQNHVRVLSVERDRYLNEQNRANEDLRNLSADLAAMTKESQLLNSELTGLARERDTLRSDLAECENQIHYLDGLVRDKDSDKDHAMNSYMKVVSERDRVDLQLRSSTEEVGSLRMEVIMRDKRIVQVQRELEDSQSMLTKLKIDLGAYEKQCSNLTKALATAERNCRHLETEKQRLLREVGAVRDLAQNFDRNRDTVQMELSSTKMEAERLAKSLEKAMAEQDHLVNELRNGKLKYERLESLLASERTRKMVLERSERDNILNQQASSLSAVTRELAVANEQLQEARRTVEQLEMLVQGQRQELEECRVRIQALSEASEKRQSNTTSVRAMSETQLNHTPSPKGVAGSNIGTPVEQQIKSQLESTKQMKEELERQIEDLKSRTSTPK
ncbi:UNVERIFIED_CONTAM: hypothetical protein HDU68_004174 [Siphonaria sp. JEL0065]|nr:hypothetical protein HDU68_004174 [Siphonaria sp. JEL0065]